MKPICLGAEVRLARGATCHVTDVLIDPRDGAQRYIALNVNGFFGPDVVAPVSAVWLVDDCVHVDLSVDDLPSLPRYNAATYCRETGLRRCAAVRHGYHWPYRAGVHYSRPHH